MRKTFLTQVLSGLSLFAVVSCGGGSSSSSNATQAPAHSLSYSNPPSSEWSLVRDASSTPDRIVLNVVGPAGLLTRGVGFNLQAPKGLKFDTFANGLLINDTGVYDLQSAAPNPGDPVALIGAVKPGNLLTVGIYQKRLEKPSKDSGSALCQIALKLDPSVTTPSGQVFTLTIPKAKVIPDDIGSNTDSQQTLSQKLRMRDIALAVGAVTAN